MIMMLNFQVEIFLKGQTYLVFLLCHSSCPLPYINKHTKNKKKDHQILETQDRKLANPFFTNKLTLSFILTTNSNFSFVLNIYLHEVWHLHFSLMITNLLRWSQNNSKYYLFTSTSDLTRSYFIHFNSTAGSNLKP